VVIRRVGKFAPTLDRAGRQAADVARTFHLTLVLSAAIGVLTGFGVAAFDASVDRVLGEVLDQNLVVLMAVPALGLVTVAVLNAIWGMVTRRRPTRTSAPTMSATEGCRCVRCGAR
jgi:hypothetical protein